MRWSFRIARLLGIDLRVHVTFFLVLFLGAGMYAHHGVAGQVFGVLMVLLLFVCVTLHEFGHAVVAQRFGIPVREIVLLPIGGVAVLGRNPRRPLDELLIAIAGPAVNVVIAGVLAAVMAMLGAMGALSVRNLTPGEPEPSLELGLAFLLAANIMLVLFNMIPAFPLDGGRVFRALLGFVMDWGRATRIAARTGQILAGLLLIAALFMGHIFLAFIAVMIFFAAQATHAEETARAVLISRRVGDAYNRYALSLSEFDTISRVVDYLLTSYQPDFAVLRGRELLGVVSRDNVLRALSSGATDGPVTSIMERVPRVDARTPLDRVREELQEGGARVAAVFDQGRYLGLVSLDDIAEAYAVLSFMGSGAELSASAAAAGTGAAPWPAP